MYHKTTNQRIAIEARAKLVEITEATRPRTSSVEILSVIIDAYYAQWKQEQESRG